MARDLGMARIAVPLFAAGLSAWGMLQTELRHEIARSVVSAEAMPGDATLAALFDGLEGEARTQLATAQATAAAERQRAERAEARPGRQE